MVNVLRMGKNKIMRELFLWEIFLEILNSFFKIKTARWHFPTSLTGLIKRHQKFFEKTGIHITDEPIKQTLSELDGTDVPPCPKEPEKAAARTGKIGEGVSRYCIC